jgi:hypothetical protein
LGEAIAAACVWLAVTSMRRAAPIVLCFALLAASSLAVAVTRLAVDTDPDHMISDRLPFRQRHHDLQRAFPALENTFVVVIDAKTGEEGLEAARALAQSFAARPDLFTDVFAPGTSSYFDDYGLLYLPEADIARIVDGVTQAAPMLALLAAKPNITGMAELVGGLVQAASAGAAPAGVERILAATDASLAGELDGPRRPLDWSALAGNDGDYLPKRWYVLASPVLDFSVLDPAAKPYNEAVKLVADPEIVRSGEVKLHLTGEAAMNAEEFHAVVDGATLAGLLSFVLVSVIVYVGMPVTRLVLPALALLVFGFLINAGFATLAVGHLNMISIAFAVLFIGLGIDYAVHVLLRFAEEAHRGAALEEAMAGAVDDMGPALALCTLTTAVAFLSFTPTAFAGMAQLGVIAAGGTVIAFLASLTLVPAVVALMPSVVGVLRAKPFTPPRANGASLGWWRLAATAAVLALAVGASLLLTSVRFDSDPVDLKDPDALSVAMFKTLLAEDPGVAYAGQLLVRPGGQLNAVKTALSALPEVADVVTIDSYLPKDQAEKLALLARLRPLLPAETAALGGVATPELAQSVEALRLASRRLADTAAAPADLRTAAASLAARLDRFVAEKGRNAEALRMLDDAWFAKFPPTLQRLTRLAAAGPLTVKEIDPDLRARFIAPDGRWRLEIVPRGDLRDEAQMETFVAAVSQVAPEATGPPIAIAGAADAVAEAMRLAVAAALVLVVIVVAPVLRRFADVLLVLAPLLLAAALLCAYTVVFDSPFNFANVIVLPLLLGLGIDSSIHYVMRAREDSENHITDTSTPRAVLVSALTTIGSFGTLWLSPHRGMASMGELLTVAIIVTLVTTLVVLPQLIAWSDRLFPPRRRRA